MTVRRAAYYMLVTILVGTTTVSSRSCDGLYQHCVSSAKRGCKDCVACGPGYERDTTVKIKWSRRCGALECYPCRRCDVGYYRLNASVLTTCSKCVQNCARLNRVTETRCGGAYKGECGDCLQGFRPGILNVNSEPCKHSVISIEKSVDKKMAEENTVSAKEQTNPFTTIFVVSIFIGVGLVVFMFTLYCVYRNRRQRRQMNIRTVSGVFQAFLMRPAGSHLNQTDIRCEKGTDRDDVTNLLSGFDRGTFHDQTGNDDIEHTDSTFASPLEGRRPIPCGFHTEIVTADHPCIADIANDLCHDEKVRAFFTRLGIQEARYIPQLEHWLRNDCDNIKYKQIMLDVLVHWCRKQGQNATLYKLTESLVTEDLTNIAVDLIERYGNEGSAYTVVNEIESVFVSQEMAELKGLSQGHIVGVFPTVFPSSSVIPLI